ncbi:MAG TPA: sigma-70 family RNA polymerase sigma factor [Phycisphaerae bacterium]|nr:sigma-70 family RNA polymerase sigma factor [Phycisphaerae bacterium]HRY70878.1 sigma-70 family RNA polymerase sigma factor [Phycisphaerae bacterium]HSA29122.1 sigma-70 family RNA polymerase sigma factor [Phycisphaerae bacterium]
MASDIREQITEIVTQAGGGGPVAEQLFQLLYEPLRHLAARFLSGENVGHTLTPTALVHEAYLKLVDQSRVDWQGKTHFLAVGAQAMRRILVDHARSRGRAKRGGNAVRLQLDEHIALSPGRDEDVLALDDALERLATLDPRQASVVEMRFFGGLSVAEAAAVLGVSKRTVEGEWTAARAWLRRELGDKDGSQ